jgi:hypothetical protein
VNFTSVSMSVRSAESPKTSNPSGFSAVGSLASNAHAYRLYVFKELPARNHRPKAQRFCETPLFSSEAHHYGLNL